MKILLCEDDPLVQRLVQLSLRGAGHELLIAGDGDEGLRLARQSRPDVVLTDITMPGMSGLELAAALRAEPGLADVRIVFLSAAEAPRLPDWARDDSLAVLAKPFAPAALRERVEALAGAQAHE